MKKPNYRLRTSLSKEQFLHINDLRLVLLLFWLYICKSSSNRNIEEQYKYSKLSEEKKDSVTKL